MTCHDRDAVHRRNDQRGPLRDLREALAGALRKNAGVVSVRREHSEQRRGMDGPQTICSPTPYTFTVRCVTAPEYLERRPPHLAIEQDVVRRAHRRIYSFPSEGFARSRRSGARERRLL